MEIVLTAEQIARVCHEANRAHCMNTGDHSQPTWDMAAPWQKESAVAGVEATLADPDRKPEDSHAAWLAHKEAAGWKYGPVKRPEVLEHPCMVPHEELPDVQKAKDHLFLAVVRALKPWTLEAQKLPSIVPPPEPDPEFEPSAAGWTPLGTTEEVAAKESEDPKPKKKRGRKKDSE